MNLNCLNDKYPLKLIQKSHLECEKCGAIYRIVNKIPRFISEIQDESLAQVQKGFQYKWMRDEWGFKPKHKLLMQSFFRERFGFSDDEALAAVDDKIVAVGQGGGLDRGSVRASLPLGQTERRQFGPFGHGT